MSILMCNTFLAIDLVLVIKNPFYPKEWRFIKLYAPISAIVGTIYGLLMAGKFHYNAANSET
jgi:hypothetical protein